jgi:hypothetical protein
MDWRRRTASLVRIPVHSAGLIMEESREASLLAGTRALVEAFMEVEVSTEAEAAMEEAVTGNSIQLLQTKLTIWRGTHAHEKYEASNI